MIDPADPAADPQLAERFGSIAAASAALLRDSHDAALIANPYLHPRNTHPGNLTLYAPLLGQRGEPQTALKNWISGLRSVGRAILDHGAAWYGDEVKAPIDVLFVSHLLRVEQAESGQDLYYGSLPAQLEAQGLRCAVVLINHTDLPWARVESRWKKQATPRILLARVLRPAAEIRHGFALARSEWSLRRCRIDDPTVADIAGRAARHARSGSARSALRIGAQIGLLAEQTRARMLVMTYEGHAWERLAMLLARRAVPDIKCVGYSHAVLFPEPRAMTASLGRALDPDFILTAGSVTRDRLSELVQMPSTGLGVLGSVRRGTAALSVDRPSRCLVLPEGLVSESAPLILAAAAAARLSHGITFRIRLHPVLSRERLLTEVPALRDLPENVEWSDQGTLEADFLASRWLLYRGTSAVFQGVEAGLKPFYLGPQDEHSSIDPLIDLEAWKVSVGSGAELAAGLSRPVDPTVESAELAIARLYCSEYFAPLNPSALIDIARQDHDVHASSRDSRFV